LLRNRLPGNGHHLAFRQMAVVNKARPTGGTLQMRMPGQQIGGNSAWISDPQNRSVFHVAYPFLFENRFL